jgi:hypothetical protein
MPENILAARAGLIMALAYTLPLLLWLLWQAGLASASQFDPALSLKGMVNAGLVLQSCALALCTPWLMRFPGLADRCAAVAMLLLVPGPLYAIAALATAVSGAGLLLAVLLLAVLALVLNFVYAACMVMAARANNRAILLPCVQFILVALCWQQRDLWQQVLWT